MYGMTRPQGLLGSMSRRLVDTRSEEEKRLEAAQLGIDGATFDRIQAVTVQDRPANTLGSKGAANTVTPPMLPDSSNQPRQPDPEVLGLLGAAPERPKSFWQGGKKFGATDALAGILAVIGDGFAQNNGQKGTAVSNLAGGRSTGLKAAQEAMEAYQRSQRVANLPNMTPREFAAYQADPKGWGGHMADAYSSHHAAANVNPGDQRVFGNPNMGGSVYQAPTSAEQYAGNLGTQPGTDDYRTAVQDYVLRGSGPTAFGYDKQLDDIRTANDMGMEGLRQRNRMQVRGAPTYRDLNPPAPRLSTGGRGGGNGRAPAVPTATGANGQKIYYREGKWVDAQGRPVQ